MVLQLSTLLDGKIYNIFLQHSRYLYYIDNLSPLLFSTFAPLFNHQAMLNLYLAQDSNSASKIHTLLPLKDSIILNNVSSEIFTPKFSFHPLLTIGTLINYMSLPIGIRTPILYLLKSESESNNFSNTYAHTSSSDDDVPILRHTNNISFNTY